MSLGRIVDFYASAITPAMYAILCALGVATVAAVLWRVIQSARPRVMADDLSPTELAYLRSDEAPVVAALAGLRASGRITTDNRVDPTVVAGPESDWFTERVLDHVRDNPAHTVRTLIAATRADLPALEKRLCERGLMRSAAERAHIRWGVLPALLMLAGGVAYCAHQVWMPPTGPEVAAILMLTVVLIPYAVIVAPALLTVDRRMRAGRRVLKAQRRRLDYLGPAQRPAFATYGPAAVAMSAALFGPAALWSVDSDYATSVEVSGDADGGDGGGCGASCGGGGDGGGGCGGCGGCGGGGGGGGCGG